MSYSDVYISTTSKDTIQAIKRILQEGQEYLKRQRANTEKNYQVYQYDIPLLEGLSLMNYSSTTCTIEINDQACEVRYSLIKEVNKQVNSDSISIEKEESKLYLNLSILLNQIQFFKQQILILI